VTSIGAWGLFWGRTASATLAGAGGPLIRKGAGGRGGGGWGSAAEWVGGFGIIGMGTPESLEDEDELLRQRVGHAESGSYIAA
jgi:hypothetical protein